MVLLRILMLTILIAAFPYEAAFAVVDPSKPTQRENVAFIQAAKNGDAESLRMLVNLGVDVDILSHDGWTALMYAAYGGHIDSVKLLLSNQANVNARAGVVTPLVAAVHSDNKDLINMLVGEGAEIYDKKSNKSEAILWGVRKNSQDIISLLLDNISSDSDKNDICTDALRLAVVIRSIDPVIISELINNGASVNAPDDHGRSVLHSAISGNAYDAKVISLLQYDVDINLVDSSGNTPLMYALIHKRRERVALKLIELDATINAVNDRGYTALSYASSNSDPQLVKLLLDKGANVNHQDSTGATPLIRSVRFRRDKESAEIAQLLIANGASVNTLDDQGGAALFYAVNNNKNNTKLIHTLILSGSDMEHADVRGRTVLIEAASRGMSDTVRMLIENGVDINRGDNRGNTALMHVVCRGHSIIVSMLVNSDANISKMNEHGETALSLALKCKRLEVVEILKGSQGNRDK